MPKTLRSSLSRWEPKLWKTGFLGYIVRLLFRMAWININHIPSEEKLWRAVNKPDQVYKDTGRPKPSFFRDRSGLSCDLARFSTPEKSRVGHGTKPYPPDSGLVEFTVSTVRALGSDVVHKPVRDPKPSYAHAQLTTVLIGDPAEDLAKAVTYRIPHGFKK
jgi:hypothetical protein